MSVTVRAEAETPRGLNLSPAERVVLTMHPWWAAWLLGYVVTLGLCEFWRRRNYLMVTNQRVFVGHGIVFIKTQQASPSTRFKTPATPGVLDRQVQISSAGGSLGTFNWRLPACAGAGVRE